MKVRTSAAPAAEEINTTNDATTPVDNGSVVTDTATTTVESVESEDDTITLDRNLYKSIKKMDRATLEGLIQDIYESICPLPYCCHRLG